MCPDRVLNHFVSLPRSVWAVMKELIILSLLINFGTGKENRAIEELSDLQHTCEEYLKELVELTENFRKNADDFGHLLRDFEEHSCIDKNVFDDFYSVYSSEMDKINLPLYDWMQQISLKIKALDVYLKHFRMHENIDDSDLERLIPQSFVGDCSVPNKKPIKPKTINTNDIYAYQNKVNCEVGGSQEFQCGSGECIGLNSTCDGTFDCWDGSDELGSCEERTGCERCPESCVQGPRGPRCVGKCPPGFEYSMKVCPHSKPCYSLCQRKIQRKPISVKCLLRIIVNSFETVKDRQLEIIDNTYIRFMELTKTCQEISKYNDNSSQGTIDNSIKEGTTTSPTWHPTSRHPTWHPTTSHPTWHPTSRHPTWHPTWHPTTRHPTWHPTTSHPTWHPTSRHPTWHPTTRHPTWHPTSRHPTWHPTTSHPTWHPTSRHPTWHPTSRHPTWHPTTSHPTWHPTSRHPTWHPTTRHPTWHPTSRHPTWHPTSRHPTWHPTTSHPTWHPTSRHPTWHPTTSHPTWHPTWHPTTSHPTWHPTTWNPMASGSIGDTDYSIQTFDDNKHHTTKHTTPHSTTTHKRHHTTKHHTTKHTTHHTTTPITPTTKTTPHTTTSKTTTLPTTTSNTD